MPWKVTAAKWLQVEADRVETVVLLPKHWNRAWTPNSLQAELLEIGLSYSMPQIVLLNDELHARGVVADLQPDPPPGP